MCAVFFLARCTDIGLLDCRFLLRDPSPINPRIGTHINCQSTNREHRAVDNANETKWRTHINFRATKTTKKKKAHSNHSNKCYLIMCGRAVAERVTQITNTCGNILPMMIIYILQYDFFYRETLHQVYKQYTPTQIGEQERERENERAKFNGTTINMHCKSCDCCCTLLFLCKQLSSVTLAVELVRASALDCNDARFISLAFFILRIYMHQQRHQHQLKRQNLNSAHFVEACAYFCVCVCL